MFVFGTLKVGYDSTVMCSSHHGSFVHRLKQIIISNHFRIDNNPICNSMDHRLFVLSLGF